MIPYNIDTLFLNNNDLISLFNYIKRKNKKFKDIDIEELENIVKTIKGNNFISCFELFLKKIDIKILKKEYDLKRIVEFTKRINNSKIYIDIITNDDAPYNLKSKLKSIIKVITEKEIFLDIRTFYSLYYIIYHEGKFNELNKENVTDFFNTFTDDWENNTKLIWLKEIYFLQEITSHENNYSKFVNFVLNKEIDAFINLLNTQGTSEIFLADILLKQNPRYKKINIDEIKNKNKIIYSGSSGSGKSMNLLCDFFENTETVKILFHLGKIPEFFNVKNTIFINNRELSLENIIKTIESGINIVVCYDSLNDCESLKRILDYQYKNKVSIYIDEFYYFAARLMNDKNFKFNDIIEYVQNYNNRSVDLRLTIQSLDLIKSLKNQNVIEFDDIVFIEKENLNQINIYKNKEYIEKKYINIELEKKIKDDEKYFIIGNNKVLNDLISVKKH